MATQSTTPDRSPVHRRPADPTPASTIGGRFLIAAAIAAAGALPASGITEYLAVPIERAFHLEERKPPNMLAWGAGNPEEVEITLVTADYDKLACAHPTAIAGAHCGYKSEQEPWDIDPARPIDDNKKDVIQPYSAVPNNDLLYVAGLWAQPEVAMRLHREPPENTPVKKLSRFIARCTVRPVERLADVSLRWEAGASWQKGILRAADGRELGAPWLVVAEKCSVRDE